MNSAKEVTAEHPLLLFSLYTEIQVKSLARLGEKLNRLMHPTQDRTDIDASNFTEFYDLFWLWVLGAYEVIRTMDQHKACFCECKRVEITQHKHRLAILRMPFAKQELRGKTGPQSRIWAELSASDFGDGAVWFTVENEKFASRQVINETINFLDSFGTENVLCSMPNRKRT